MIGENIQKLRKEKKITQSGLAEYLGLSCAAIYKYERNLAEPDIESLIKIADLFNVSVDFLIGRTDKSNYEWKSSTKAEIEQGKQKATEVLKDPNNWIPSQEELSATVLREMIRAEVKRAMSEANSHE